MGALGGVAVSHERGSSIPETFRFPSLLKGKTSIPGAECAPGLGASSRLMLSHTMYSLISFRKSPFPQNRRLIAYYYLSKHQVDVFWGGGEFLKLTNEYIL